MYLTIALNQCMKSCTETNHAGVPYDFITHMHTSMCLILHMILHQNIDYFANELSLHQMYDCQIFTLIDLRFVSTLKKRDIEADILMKGLHVIYGSITIAGEGFQNLDLCLLLMASEQ